MKKLFVILALLLLLMYATTSFAHPGRTDYSGGHTDHSTGDYHYHHGYEEHYHTNGQCPYDYVIDYENDYSSNAVTPSVNHAINDNKKSSVFSTVVEFIKSSDFLLTLVIAILFSTIISVIIWLKEWVDGLIYSHKEKKRKKEKD